MIQLSNERLVVDWRRRWRICTGYPISKGGPPYFGGLIKHQKHTFYRKPECCPLTWGIVPFPPQMAKGNWKLGELAGPGEKSQWCQQQYKDASEKKLIILASGSTSRKKVFLSGIEIWRPNLNVAVDATGPETDFTLETDGKMCTEKNEHSFKIPKFTS